MISTSIRRPVDAYVRHVRREAPADPKRLRIFDFDDTLVRTDAMVHVTHLDGSKSDLKPAEFAVYVPRVGDVFNYDDFQMLINPRPVRWMNRILRNVYDHHGAQGLVILSARTSAQPIFEFLTQQGIHGVEIVALNSADPQAKAGWVDARIVRDGLHEVEMFDDSHKNVAAIKALQSKHPNTAIIARHVHHRRASCLLES